VKGSGTHDKTGHHCLPNDPNGKLNIAHHAGYWLHGDDGRLTKAFEHICWDGCMFPNAVMMKPETWNDILRAMIAVRDAHGWREEAEETAAVESAVVIQTNRRPSRVAKPVARKVAVKRIPLKRKAKTKAPAHKAKASKKPKKSSKPVKKGKMKKVPSKSAKSKAGKSATKSKTSSRKPAKKKG